MLARVREGAPDRLVELFAVVDVVPDLLADLDRRGGSEQILGSGGRKDLQQLSGELGRGVHQRVPAACRLARVVVLPCPLHVAQQSLAAPTLAKGGGSI